MTEKYLDGIIRKFKTGKTTEHSFRGDLQDFIERTVTGVQAINEPTRQKCGAPDYIIQKKNIPIGYIEAKDIDKNLDIVEKSEQLDRYRASLDNLILTNYLEFRFFVNGEYVDTVKVADIINGKIKVYEKEYQKLVEEIEDELMDYHLRMEKFLRQKKPEKSKEWKNQFNDLIIKFADEAELLMDGHPEFKVKICRNELQLKSGE